MVKLNILAVVVAYPSYLISFKARVAAQCIVIRHASSLRIYFTQLAATVLGQPHKYLSR